MNKQPKSVNELTNSYVYVCVYIYIYIYAYTHIYIYIYILIYAASGAPRAAAPSRPRWRPRGAAGRRPRTCRAVLFFPPRSRQVHDVIPPLISSTIHTKGSRSPTAPAAQDSNERVLHPVHGGQSPIRPHNAEALVYVLLSLVIVVIIVCVDCVGIGCMLLLSLVCLYSRTCRAYVACVLLLLFVACLCYCLLLCVKHVC